MALLKNKNIQLSIDAVASDGNGIGRHEGQVVFVPGALPGDKAEVKILKVAKKHAYGRIETLLRPGPSRIESDCPVSRLCGGCCFRELAYEAEREIKRGFVRDALLRIGGLDLPVLPALTGGPAQRYRNMVQYPVALVDGALQYGFYARHSHRVVPCGDCKLQPENLNKIAKKTAEWLRQKGVAPYDEEQYEGLVRHICLRQSSLDEGVLLTLVLNGHRLPGERELAENLAQTFPTLRGLLCNENTKRGNVIFGANSRVVLGQAQLADELCGVPQKLSPTSFSQVNHAGAERLFSLVGQWAAPQPEEVLLDLYCGTGVIGLSMARKCKTLIGVEIDRQAVQSARESAEEMGLSNARFLCEDAQAAAERLRQEGVRPDIAVLDPPRKGCGEKALQPLLRMAPGRVVMVSCNPATLARDLAFLAKNGYAAEKVQPVDLFPRTRHIETVVLLKRK
ncbi:23S rRNA (uracil(1939)-C(5))-methyltransferase RlmD [Ruminococcaceae bacterium OttesenSCG-928-I18]|nr:23S rRNA (uracil(1939)-C(5))-methyltransferase RlmD [Ruminococcaceae bacterium OttesenSCG-928-I18]